MKNLISVISLALLIPIICNAQKWKAYKDPAEAGFSPERLKEADQYFKKKGGAALLVIYKGNVLLSSGKTTQKYMTHSMRKSFLSALYGVNSKKINLSETLEDLGINELQLLTESEKKATVSDLLKARSGIYLPSAYSPQNMVKNLPARGSHLPGLHWYYNNWDFNVLGTIFQKKTGLDIFNAFQKQIAVPIGMEDFDLQDTYLRIEPGVSAHPAYLFKMSARDLARFGQLYLNKGTWSKRNVVPESWINITTRIHSTDLGRFNSKGAYGMLWWVANIARQPMYYASGIGGHRICILPQSDIVIVHQTDTYQNKDVDEASIDTLITLIATSKGGKAIKSPSLINYEPPVINHRENYKVNPDILSKYYGKYQHSQLGKMEIKSWDGKIIVETGVGIFRLYAKNDTEFIIEDMEILLEFKKAEANQNAHTINLIFSQKKEIERIKFLY